MPKKGLCPLEDMGDLVEYFILQPIDPDAHFPRELAEVTREKVLSLPADDLMIYPGETMNHRRFAAYRDLRGLSMLSTIEGALFYGTVELYGKTPQKVRDHVANHEPPLNEYWAVVEHWAKLRTIQARATIGIFEQIVTEYANEQKVSEALRAKSHLYSLRMEANVSRNIRAAEINALCLDLARPSRRDLP